MFIATLSLSIWSDNWLLMLIPFGAIFFIAGWQHINAVFLLMIVSLPLSMEMQVSGGFGTDFPDELLMLFTTFLFFLYWIYHPSAISKTLFSHPLILLLLLTLGWAMISSLFSTHPFFSLKFLLAKCWYLGAFVLAPLIAFQSKSVTKQAFILLSWSMVAVAIIALARHSQSGFAFAEVNQSLTPFFRNHVSYSAMLVCILPLFYFFYIMSASRTMKLFLTALGLILLIALFFSYARGAWLALLTGTAGFFLIRRKIMAAVFVTVMLLVLGAVYWLKSDDRYLNYAHDYRTTIYHEDFRQHLQATYQFKDASTAERFYRWIAGVRMIKGNELLGFGPSTFYHNYKPYAVPAFKTWVSDNPEKSTVHNYFLLLAIEQGIPGLLFFLLLVTAMLLYAQRVYARQGEVFYRMAALVAGVVLVMILTVNFLSDLVETDKVGSLFLLCISMLIIADVKTRSSLLPENSDSSSHI